MESNHSMGHLDSWLWPRSSFSMRAFDLKGVIVQRSLERFDLSTILAAFAVLMKYSGSTQTLLWWFGSLRQKFCRSVSDT
jgi:hypothetical protein